MSEQAHQAAAAAAGDDQAVVLDAKLIEKTFRQVATYGVETMSKLISIKVLIVGCRGVGAEAAKNLTLAGVHTVTLFDNAVCTVRDQGSNFAITGAHVASKATRAEATASLTKQLNPNCRVSIATELTKELIQKYDVTIVTSGHSNLSLAELTRINDACRARTPAPASFMFVFTGGPLGSVFVDNGVGFITRDPDGRDALQKAITEIIPHRVDKKGRTYSIVRFTVPEGMRPGSLRDTTEVTFSDVKGLVHTATGESIAKAKAPFFGVHGINDAPGTLRIYPSLQDQGYSEHISGGFIHEVKEVLKFNFRTFIECLQTPPAHILTDSMMDGTAENKAHLTLAALIKYADNHDGALPPVLDAAAADEVARLATVVVEEGKARAAALPPVAPTPEAPEDPLNEWPGTLPPPPPPAPFVVDEVDVDFVRRAASVAGAQLQPLCALLGAIIAQEVVKITGKFTPIYQWLHFNQSSVLPDDVPTDSAPVGDRYDDLRALFGNAFATRLQNLKLFMVGCGALGCEYIKNFALCGICCGPEGRLTVTDNDRIEVSNLNRQFLFREDNIGQQKSVAAGLRAREMNPALQMDARTDFVGDTTENLFPDSFWASLDVVTNALDNMAARLYVDDRCVLFEKVLVEAGTMGTGGNVDIIVPNKTTTYADGGAADDTGGIPMCTLRNFPYIYDHCIEWARAQFDDLFISPIMSAQMLRENPEAFVKKIHDEVMNQTSVGQKRSLLEKHVKSLQGVIKVADMLTKPNVTMEECVALAWATIHSQFRDRILSLTKAFPHDAKKKNGSLFWSGHHKFPTALEARLDDPEVFDFLIATSNLFACMLGVHEAKHAPHFNDNFPQRWKSEYRTRAWLEGVIAKLPVPEVSLTAVDDLDEESAAAATSGGDSADEDAERNFLALLEKVRSYGGRLSDKAQPLDFEKDDDDNFHIDFVAAAANLRARNYDIPTKDRVAVKLIAGKIIPAIATTTAAVTGIALLEYFKVLQGKDVSLVRNGFIDLGGNTWTMFDRDAPKKVKSHVKKTYYAEQDYTEETQLVAYPNPHTVFTKIFVDVTPATTVAEFGELLVGPTESAEEGPYEIASVGVGKGRLWDGMPKHANANKPLLALIAEQLGKDPVEFWKGRDVYHRLAVNLDTAEGNEVIPATVVLRIQH